MNAKFLLVVALVCLAVSTTTAAPRVKRFTCTFMGDWACETHCYALNRQGGWCDSRNTGENPMNFPK
ncbi:hypothetical protein MAR_001531, partial [Mya arenaria]